MVPKKKPQKTKTITTTACCPLLSNGLKIYRTVLLAPLVAVTVTKSSEHPCTHKIPRVLKILFFNPNVVGLEIRLDARWSLMVH